jgi:hypothetical protein
VTNACLKSASDEADHGSARNRTSHTMKKDVLSANLPPLTGSHVWLRVARAPNRFPEVEKRPYGFRCASGCLQISANPESPVKFVEVDGDAYRCSWKICGLYLSRYICTRS